MHFRSQPNSTVMRVHFVLPLLVSLLLLPPVLRGQDLVAQYAFSGNANDGTANGLHATVVGARLTTDRLGTDSAAYVFDSSLSSIQVPDNALLRPQGVTVSVWVYVEKAHPMPSYSGNNKNTNNQYIIFKPNPRTSGRGLEGYSLYYDQSTRTFNAAASQPGGWQIAVSSPVVALKTWYHVVMTADANDVRIYTNGVFRNLANTDFPLNYRIGAPLMMGRTGNIAWEGNLLGKIDDVCIFNRVARPDEIAAMYAHGCATATSLFRFTNSRLPILSLLTTNGTHIPDEPKIPGDMQVFWHPDGSQNYTADVPHYTGKVGVERRGSSSGYFPQKSYAIEFRDASGADVDVPLLGMPAESDWVLHAPWCDKTMMNNALALSLGREMGRYAPRTRHVELVINGDYKGVYVLMEKIKRGPDRLDISNLKTTDLTGDALTGGYIVKIDKTDGGDANLWFSPYRPCWNKATEPLGYQIDYPDPASALQPVQKTYIKNYVTAFEDALYGADFQDSLLGYRQFADLNSFIDYSIIQELSHNVDGYRLSTYLHKPKDSKGGKLIAGPLWDLNLSFGNADYINGWAYNDFIWDQPKIICPNGPYQHPDFWRKMNQDTAYWRAYRCRYKELRNTVLSTAAFDHKVDSMAALLTEAQGRHYQRWPILGYYVWPNKSLPKTYSAALDTLRTWTHKRLTWLDNNLKISDCRCTTPQSCAKPPTGVADFAANASGDEILLTWKTAMEDNLHRFLVTRSTDAVAWDTVGTVYASGVSSVPLAYQFADASVGNGTYYYRLVLVNTDDTRMPSQTRRVMLSGSDKVFVSPNPASDAVLIRLPEARLTASLTLEVVDVTGKAVLPQQPVTEAETTFSVATLAPGMYLLRLSSGNWDITRKLMVVR